MSMAHLNVKEIEALQEVGAAMTEASGAAYDFGKSFALYPTTQANKPGGKKYVSKSKQQQASRPDRVWATPTVVE